MKALSIGSFESFWKAALLTGGVAAWSLPAWNVIVNPYQIFKTEYSMGSRYTSSTTNERYLKVEYLLRDAKERYPDSAEAIVSTINSEIPGQRVGKSGRQHDAFIVGSSIMGLVDPGVLNTRFPGRDFYNLAFLAAKPDEILATLKALKRKGVPIKNVIYGLEPIAFTDIKSYGPAYRLHPEAGGETKQRVIFDYLFASSLSDGFGRLINEVKGIHSVRYDIEDTGRYFLDRYDQEIKQDQATFIRKQFPINAKPANAQPWIKSRFDDFEELVKWLHDEKVDASFYLNPLHPHVMKAYGDDRLEEFRKKIAELTGQANISDCTHLLSTDQDANQRFYDYKHFRDTESETVMNCALSSRNELNERGRKTASFTPMKRKGFS
ncbi:hypothetical protein [Methylomicrobium sp. Wu6]|uniref:hypothetical protein n=1 Tax=Methylomicrobium sp. Wu6 TaxID=3107928 RepID=UPI002DD67902|nr:hypothetical protein [Methylomicrobium sp. Wu6]MEC4749851.1 hypothetical protein [Methylomicrobium sp. Wu6]